MMASKGRALQAVAWLATAVQGFSADATTFHGNRLRTGWIDDEQAPSIRAVASESFGELWQSPELDWIDGRPPRLYATPLYLGEVDVPAGTFPAGRYGVIFAATSNGFVYAINAVATSAVPAGSILWRTDLVRLTQPTFDGINIGVISTPVIDSVKKILYVTSCASPEAWQVFALDVGSGHIRAGWPVTIDAKALAVPGINRNAPTEPDAPLPKRALFAIQRGALNLSPDGGHLYVTFGEAITGWLVAVDTGAQPHIASAFAAVRHPHRTTGGIWGAGGPAIDEQGNVFVVSGTNFGSLKVQSHDWTQSVLEFGDSSAEGLMLRGTYTPFNYGDTASADIDLGSGGACLIPALPATETATPHLMALGGKQGNVYLLDRSHLPGGLVDRPAVTHDSASDASLLSPAPQPQFGRRGPLNVFGPYSETKGAIDKARSRSVPAYFHSLQGNHFLFVTGHTKVAEDADAATAPSLARLKIVTAPGQPAYLELDQVEPSLVFENPGSPLVSSRSGHDAIVWVLDENAPRTTLLSGERAPRPVLYALDALTLKLLWRSPVGALHTSGKYNEPLILRGTVFVGTDRIQAFGQRSQIPDSPLPATLADPAPSKPAVDVAALSGKELYLSGGACAVCHGTGGEGLAGINPPLAGSDWVNGSEERLIRIMLHGLQGPVRVSGQLYNGAAMPGFGQLTKSPFNWDDAKIALVLNYIRQAWGNRAAAITVESVTRVRQQTGERDFWTEEELRRVSR
jgi:mono/diheme cytochrome c family protein